MVCREVKKWKRPGEQLKTQVGPVGHQPCAPLRRRIERPLGRASARRRTPRERHRADVWSAT
eukprot:2378480-Amphidinium_carterae.3